MQSLSQDAERPGTVIDHEQARRFWPRPSIRFHRRIPR
jgi:hypothetical protein